MRRFSDDRVFRRRSQLASKATTESIEMTAISKKSDNAITSSRDRYDDRGHADEQRMGKWVVG